MKSEPLISDVQIDKAKFDAVLQRLIASPPTSMEAAKAMPKLKKDGTPKKKRTVAK
jgi:hypothetical protein